MSNFYCLLLIFTANMHALFLYKTKNERILKLFKSEWKSNTNCDKLWSDSNIEFDNRAMEKLSKDNSIQFVVLKMWGNLPVRRDLWKLWKIKF